MLFVDSGEFGSKLSWSDVDASVGEGNESIPKPLAAGTKYRSSESCSRSTKQPKVVST